MPFSRGFSPLRDPTEALIFFTTSAIWEVPKNSLTLTLYRVRTVVFSILFHILFFFFNLVIIC